MDRRNFFKKSIGATVAAGVFLPNSTLFAERLLGLDMPDLVAIKGGEPEQMFRKGIDAFGGIGTFVKKGQKVVVKPNIGWDVSLERAGNTHPKLVTEIIHQCFNAGAKEVIVFDHTCDDWKRCYARSGIEAAVKSAGGTMISGNTEGSYREVSVPKGKKLTTALEHEAILNADVFINVPILKCHSGSRLTMGMKNLMGNVWDRQYWHRTDLHQCIADFATFRKPTLNVLDAYYVMKENGPRGVSVEDVITMKAQLISTDILALDTAGAKLFGIDPGDVRHIKLAAEQGVGRMDLDKLNIKRMTV